MGVIGGIDLGPDFACGSFRVDRFGFVWEIIFLTAATEPAVVRYFKR